MTQILNNCEKLKLQKTFIILNENIFIPCLIYVKDIFL